MKKLFCLSILFSSFSVFALLGSNETFQNTPPEWIRNVQYLQNASPDWDDTQSPDVHVAHGSVRDKINYFNQQYGGRPIMPIQWRTTPLQPNDLFLMKKKGLDDPEYQKLLVKINDVCDLNGHVGLYEIALSPHLPRSLSFNENFTEADFQTIAKLLNLPIVVLDVYPQKTGLFGLFPHFFNSLNIFLPDGTSNVCLPGHFKDDNVKNALRDHCLGPKPNPLADRTFVLGNKIQSLPNKAKWNNPRVTIQDWYKLWMTGQLLFFVTYNRKQFIVEFEFID